MTPTQGEPSFAGRLRARLGRKLESSRHQLAFQRANRRLEREGPPGLDPRTRFPAYLSLDRVVDVDRMRAMDAELTATVRTVLEDGSSFPFHTGDLKKGLLKPQRPGSRVIALSESSRTDGVFDYFELDDTTKWKPAPVAERFGPLLEFIDTLPFESTARIVILCDPLGRRVTTHRDHGFVDRLHEFLWFRTNLEKPLFLQNPRTKEKRYVEGHTAWFDTVNQYHGIDPTPGLSISVRVDGRFTGAFRARFPAMPANRASLPSLWATLEGGELGPSGADRPSVVHAPANATAAGD